MCEEIQRLRVLKVMRLDTSEENVGGPINERKGQSGYFFTCLRFAQATRKQF